MTGEQIKAARRDAGLSRSELAKRVGVSPRTVEGWEQGRHHVGNAAAVGLRRVLKLKNSVDHEHAV